MSTSTRRERTQEAQSAAEDDHASGLTRRTVLAGWRPPLPLSRSGWIHRRLRKAPFRTWRPLYNYPQRSRGFRQESSHPPRTLSASSKSISTGSRKRNRQHSRRCCKSLRIIRTPQAIIDRSQASDDTKFLARSIVLIWYLGSWYSPADLKRLVDDRLARVPLFVRHTVISPKAYTQGWVWRIAQAHPMGYSDMQFGYWARDPAPLEDFLFRTTRKGT
jgi:hypothetical protein